MINVTENERRRVRKTTRDPVKLTALLYLKEALQKEQYEICAELIWLARDLGAADFEVRDLLEDPRRKPR